MSQCPVMTTYAGKSVADNQRSVTAGERGLKASIRRAG
jgi:hypothetical protein